MACHRYFLFGQYRETLDGVREVISAGGTVVGICSGGELEESSLNPKDRCASMCLRAKCPALPLGISSGLNYLPVGHWNSSETQLVEIEEMLADCLRRLQNQTFLQTPGWLPRSQDHWLGGG